MKPGDLVTVYDNPITKKNQEGVAQIIEIRRPAHCPGDPAYVRLRFIDDYDKQEYSRWVHASDVI